MDTMFTSKRVRKSYRGYTCVQVYATEFGWVQADLMRAERDLHNSLKSMFKEIGVPMKLIADGARAQVAGKTRILCEQANCKVVDLEKNTPFANQAERYIQTLKNESKSDMVCTEIVQLSSGTTVWKEGQESKIQLLKKIIY